MKPGDTLSLTVEKPAAGGRMIARAGGRVVLVSGAIPGEQVRARVERVGKGVVYAAAIAVDEPSPDRRDTGSDPACGGCLYAHVAYPRQLQLKSLVIADAFTRIGRMELPGGVEVAASPEEGYRMRARLHVHDARIGFYREGTHQLCDAAQTRQLQPATLEVLERLAAGLQQMPRDAVREVILAENIDASERVIGLETGAPIAAPMFAPAAAIDGVSGLVVSSAAIKGRPYVTDRIRMPGGSDLSLRRHVLAFFQGNRFLFEDLVAHVAGRVEQGASLVDLYAGGGAFALSAAIARGARVTAVEGDRIAASDLTANAAPVTDAVTPVRASVEAFLEANRTRPQIVILDPPRTGLSPGALRGIAALRAPRVIYVSCDVATLARDARALVENEYRVDEARAFDLFPNTPHIETVVTFDRL